MSKRPYLQPVVLLLAVCMISALLAPAPVSAAKKRILHFAAKEPESLDPHSSTQGPVQAMARFIYRGLTRFAIKDGKVTTLAVEPDLAESWTVSEDGTEWTFALRKGVQFHKGFGEMTAEDVKFSFERQLQRTKGMLFAQNIDVIKAITVLDPYTIRFTLDAYDPVFLLRMVGYQHGYILSKKAVEKYGENYSWNPVGTGPFAFEKHLPREKIILKAHEAYYFGRPQIDEVQWFDVPEDATKLIGLEKGTFDILYPEIVTADFEAQVKKIGAVLDKRGPGSQERFYIKVHKSASISI